MIGENHMIVIFRLVRLNSLSEGIQESRMIIKLVDGIDLRDRIPLTNLVHYSLNGRSIGGGRILRKIRAK